MFLIDTDILIYSLKGHPVVTASFAEHRDAPKSLSVVSYGELLFGAKKSQHPDKSLAAARRAAELFPLLPITKPIIETVAELRASLETGGTRLDDMDLLIAATALTHNLVLVTNNQKHFARIESLQTENWSA